MKIILSHPTGNANVRALIKSLFDENVLSQFYTTIASFPGTFVHSLSAIKQFSELKRREFPPELNVVTHTSPGLEVGRIIAEKLDWRKLIKPETGIFSIDSVYHHIDKKVASKLKHLSKKGVDAVYAYEDGALASFKQAKSLGLKCIYDLPIAYWETVRGLMLEEAERLPAWAITLGGGAQDSDKKLERKTEELELADVVIGPGDFVIYSLPTWAEGKKLITSPFGSPDFLIKPEKVFDKGQPKNKPLRVLFAGSLGQRKGLGDLFQAIKLLKRSDIELIVMGPLLAPINFYRSHLPNFVYEHTRPHQQVLELMKTCDVFCLPSIVEGRALVMQEAMSQGLPLIITPNTGGADLIKEGETGFLVPIRSPEKIAEKLTFFIENRTLAVEMGKKAMEHAKRYTWKKYGDIIVNSLREYLNK